MSAQADALMGIFGFKRTTCKSCDHSIGRATPGGSALWCQKYESEAKETCQEFVFAPGSDEAEAYK